MATRAVAAGTANKYQDYDTQRQDGTDYPRYLHPAWGAWVGGRIGHVGFLRRLVEGLHFIETVCLYQVDMSRTSTLSPSAVS